MPAEVLTINDTLAIDTVATEIARQWVHWDSLRQNAKVRWEETRKYKYAVDTTTTTNNKLPWKNKTTYPKLTQIADNLKANYIMSLFPRRQWMTWEAFDEAADSKKKRDIIEQYMMSVVENSDFLQQMGLLLDDWIDFGNCFSTVEWVDQRIQQPNGMQVGYVGPRPVRISPFDIVFNPIAATFADTPKIIRKFVTLGDLKSEIESLTPLDNHAEELWNYLKDIRNPGHKVWSVETAAEDSFYQVDGFTSFQQYLGSDFAEVMTFYGDLFMRETGTLYKNAVITLVDRHKLIANVPNESLFGKAPIYHSAWRARQDNLWGMGPLDNLVGMQYRIDHLENLKADVFDLNAFPPLKIKGVISDDFEWGPMERIYLGDDGDVNMVAPHFEILNTNTEISTLEKRMEEIAGAPGEAMGIRSPGEKTKYEVQRLENAAARIFQFRLNQFEAQQVEQQLTAHLELARRKMVSSELRMFDSNLKISDFQSITAQDLMGNGRIRPVAAKHFAEQAMLVQNLTAFANSALGQDPAVNVHISGLKMAKLFEQLMEAERFQLVQPFIRIAEQHEAQNLSNVSQEKSLTQMQTPSGMPGDSGALPRAQAAAGKLPPGISQQSPLGARGGGPKVPLIRSQLGSAPQQGAPLGEDGAVSGQGPVAASGPSPGLVGPAG